MKIKFLTLNIFNGGKFFERVVDFVKSEDPDVAFFQEVTHSEDESFGSRDRALEELTQHLEYPHMAYSPAFYDPSFSKKWERGNLILSKFPLKPGEPAFFDFPYGPFKFKGATVFFDQPSLSQHASMDCNGLEIHLFNVHGLWGKHGDDTEKRLQMGEIILSQIKDKERVILAGDFNLRPNTRTIKSIEQELVNVFKDELVSTFNMKHKNLEGFATSVVDMIFVSSDITVLDHHCPEVDVSDHLPLVATFGI